MKYILEYNNFNQDKPKVKITIPDKDGTVLETPILELEADINGASSAFVKHQGNFIGRGLSKFDGSKLKATINLVEGLNKFFVGGKSSKGETGWAYREVYYKIPGSKITITNPSEETTETYDSMISLEANIEDAKTVSVEHNGKIFNKSWFSFDNNKLFVEKIYLVKGPNIIKIKAEDEAGGKTEKVKEISLLYVPNINFDGEESRKIADEIKRLVLKYWTNEIYKETYIRKNNILVETELLTKWFWNKKFRSFFAHKFSVPQDVNQFIKALRLNEFDIFDVNGKYFEYFYNVLIKTSTVGEKNEKLGMMYFDAYQTKIGNTPTYKKASKSEDAFDSIDSFAMINGEKFTIQIKTCENLISKNDIYKVKCSGDFRKITTDYLILASEKQYFIIKVPPTNTWSETYFESNDMTNTVTFHKELLLDEKL